MNLDVIDALAKAAANKRQLRFNYRKPGATEAEPRVVDPYHLANINSEWFLFAHCHLRNDVRTFTPARIKGMVETGVTFEPPEGFSLEERLRGSFAIVTGDEEQEIVIRFNELVADYIREKKWHPSQEQRDLEDGDSRRGVRVSRRHAERGRRVRRRLGRLRRGRRHIAPKHERRHGGGDVGGVGGGARRRLPI